MSDDEYGALFIIMVICFFLGLILTIVGIGIGWLLLIIAGSIFLFGFILPEGWWRGSSANVTYHNTNIGELTYGLVPNLRSEYEAAPLIQRAQHGRTVWQPTPVISHTSLTQDHVMVNIDVPRRIRAGGRLRILVDVTNCHVAERLRDSVLLEITPPLGVPQWFGPNILDIKPDGDTAAFTYLWGVPIFRGNYILRFLLTEVPFEASKVVVVE